MLCFLTLSSSAEQENKTPKEVPIETNNEKNSSREKFWYRLKINIKERLMNSSLRYAITGYFLYNQTKTLITTTYEKNGSYSVTKSRYPDILATVLGIAFLYDCIQIVGESL